MKNKPGEKRSGLLPAFLIFSAVLVFYLLNLVAEYSHDGIAYSQMIEKEKFWGVFHSHHLLYNYFKWIIWHLLGLAGINVQALYLAQAFNAVFGALAAAFFYLLLRRSVESAYIRFACVFALVFVYGFWYCSTFAGVRIAHIALMSALLMLLAHYISRKEKDFLFNAAFAVLIGLLHSLIVLFHQAHYLAAGIVAAAFLMRKDRFSSKAMLFSIYIAVLIIVSGGTYVLIGSGYYGVTDYASFMKWFRNYADYGWWGKFTENSLSLAITGLRHFFFGNPQAVPRIFLGVGEATAVAVFSGVFIACLLGFFIFIRRIFEKVPAYAVLSLTWLVFYVPFFVWWEPYNQEFWVFVVMPLFLLAALFLDRVLAYLEGPWLKRGLIVLLGLVCAAYAAFNYFGPIAQKKEKEKNWTYTCVKEALSVSSDDADLFILNGEMGGLDHALGYFTKKRLFSFIACLDKRKGDQKAAVLDLGAEIEAAFKSGKRVFLERHFFGRDKVAFIVSKHPSFDKAALEGFFLTSYTVTQLKHEDGLFCYYELCLKPRAKK